MRGRNASADLTTLDARRVCVIKPSALGDVVQCLPLLPVLRERFPSATISWVVNRELSELLAGHPDLDTVVPFDRRGGFLTWRRMWNDLRNRDFDLVFDLQGLLRTGLMTLATKAKCRVGLETAREMSHWACDVLIPDSGRDVAAHARYWRVAEALGLGDRTPQTVLPLTDEHREWALSQLSTIGRPTLVLNPGAKWVTKRWPVEKFAVVASKACRTFGFSAVIVGGPGDGVLTEQLHKLLDEFLPSGQVVNLSGKTSLLQLAAVLEAADAVLSNDSGPMHLAAGVGTPVVGIFTCTSAVRSGPPGDRHALVSTRVGCAASYRKKCPHRGRRHLACLDELDVERVWQGLQSVVRNAGRKAA